MFVANLTPPKSFKLRDLGVLLGPLQSTVCDSDGDDGGDVRSGDNALSVVFMMVLRSSL